MKTYPIKIANKLKFIKEPVKRKNGKWVGVNCYKDGHQSSDDPILVEYEEQGLCQKACNIHNKYLGFSLNEADNIIAKSMGILEWEKGEYLAHNVMQ